LEIKIKQDKLQGIQLLVFPVHLLLKTEVASVIIHDTPFLCGVSKPSFSPIGSFQYTTYHVRGKSINGL
jgi:hypothetical protein